MDNKKLNHIKSLILKQLCQDISSKEQQELDVWTGHSPANSNLLKDFYSKAFLSKVMHTDDSELMEKRWKQLKQLTIRKKRLQIYKRYAVGAAVMLPFLILGPLLSEHWTFKKDILISESNADSKTLVYWADGCTTTTTDHKNIPGKVKKDTIKIKEIEGPVQTSFNRIVIPRGAEYIVKLTDGSCIHLNSESELEVPVNFSAGNRNIRLKGGAYFDIVHNTDSPFIVRTKDTEINVLGTSFDVRAYDDQPNTLTTLIRGKVRVNSSSSQVILQPGMQAQVESNGDISVQKVNTNRYTAWLYGRFIFENETIGQIMHEVARWYDFEYIIDDPAINDIRITMNIARDQSFSEFFRTIERIEKIQFRMEGQKVYVTKIK